MQFNLHTHTRIPNQLAIVNHQIGMINSHLDDNVFFSAGIHPWDLDSINIETAYKDLNTKLMSENCVAIGEFGLDKLCGTDLDLQKDVFQEQLAMAHQSGKKVLIIHCVKAYQELIKEKMSCPHPFTWILHGFNGGRQLIEQLLAHGFYFSLGELLFNSSTKIVQSAQFIPLDKLFLETDDSNHSLETVYNKAAELLMLNQDSLEQQIEHNIQAVFPDLLSL